MSILLVALNDQESDIRTFLDTGGWSLPVLVDGPGQIAGAYGVTAVPTAVFIDAQGNIGNTKIGGATVDDLVALVGTVR